MKDWICKVCKGTGERPSGGGCTFCKSTGVNMKKFEKQVSQRMKESEFWGSLSEETRQHITDIDAEERAESAENRRGGLCVWRPLRINRHRGEKMMIRTTNEEFCKICNNHKTSLWCNTCDKITESYCKTIEWVCLSDLKKELTKLILSASSKSIVPTGEQFAITNTLEYVRDIMLCNSSEQKEEKKC
jgi:hypothetical protein